jgi:LuxR family maltose regulon positive regulatory protein
MLPINATFHLKAAWLNWAKGDLAATRLALKQVEDLHPYPHSSRFIEQIMASRAELALRLGDLTTVNEWRQAVNLDATEPLTYLRESELIVLAQLLTVQSGAVSTPGEVRQPGLDLLERLAQFATTGGRNGRLIKILVWQAVAYHQAGNLSQAVAVLGRALVLAEAEGFVRTFVEAGSRLAALLRQVPVTGSTQLYVKRLLAAFSETASESRDLSVTDGHLAQRHSPPHGVGLPPAELIEPLSERELEVLSLVAAGLSNKEIADQLVLAVSTVKRHMSNIYGKLGVSSRTQSLVRARELGLLVD